MKCLNANCRNTETEILKTEKYDSFIKRLRKCKNCGDEWWTKEETWVCEWPTMAYRKPLIDRILDKLFSYLPLFLELKWWNHKYPTPASKIDEGTWHDI